LHVRLAQHATQLLYSPVEQRPAARLAIGCKTIAMASAVANIDNAIFIFRHPNVA